MANVRNLVVAEAKGPEKGDGCHYGYNPFHFDRDRDREKVSATIGEENRAGDQNSKNRSGSADRRNVVSRLTPQHRNRADNNVENASTDSGNKVVAQKAIASPDQFEFAAKRPQHEHLDQDVPDAVDLMQEKIRKGLPHAQPGNYAARHQSEPEVKTVFRLSTAQVIDKNLQEENGAVRYEQQLNAGCDEKFPVHAVIADVRARSHAVLSLRVDVGGVKPASLTLPAVAASRVSCGRNGKARRKATQT